MTNWRVGELITDVRTRLNVAERLANTQADLDGEIPVLALSPTTS